MFLALVITYTFLVNYISRSQALAWECMVRGSASGLVLELWSLIKSRQTRTYNQEETPQPHKSVVLGEGFSDILLNFLTEL